MENRKRLPTTRTAIDMGIHRMSRGRRFPAIHMEIMERLTSLFTYFESGFDDMKRLSAIQVYIIIKISISDLTNPDPLPLYWGYGE